MNKATLEQRLLAAADWIERMDESPAFRRVIYYFLAFSVGFFGKVIVDILVR